MATAWLSNGATAFGVWVDGKAEAVWPEGATEQGNWLASTVASGSATGLIELRAGGVQDDAARVRLEADSALVSDLLRLEAEVDGLAGALAETEDQLLALYELTKTGPGQLDIDRLLENLVSQAERLVDAKGAFVVLAPARVVSSPSVDAAEAVLLDLFERVRSGGGELLLNASDLSESGSGAKTNLFVIPLPFREQREVMAAMGLWLSRPAAVLSPVLKLVRSIAEQAGAQLEIALQHEKLIGQARLQAEMELARQVQHALLPDRAPQIEGLEIHGESRPALVVGGDFFDFIVSRGAGERSCMFVVGDVSGKGLPAALLMVMARSSLRRSALRGADDHSPETILARASADLYDDLTEVGMMATVFVGRYSPAAGMLSYANAGHSPVIFCPLGGPARLLEADGPAVGVLPDMLSENQMLPFGPGDVLVAATDGFNEERNVAGEFFGIERLLGLVEALAPQPSRAIAEGLLTAVAQFSAGAPPDDDQTVVVLKGR